MNLHDIILTYLPYFVGAGSVPTIQQTVQFIRKEFFRNNKWSAYFAPIFAIVIGALINWAAAIYIHGSPIDGIVLGLLAGALASGYHEMTH